MAKKLEKIILKSDSDKKFSGEVFDLIRTQLTPKVGGNVNLGVKLAAEAFVPRMPASVTAAEMGDAIPQIATKFEAESQKPAASNSGRLPLNDEAQAAWAAGQWRGKLAVHGLRERFKSEIKDDVDLTVSMINAYVAELADKKAQVAELVAEHDDPDSGPVRCAYVAHRGDEKSFQPNVAYKLFRNGSEELERQKHDQGGELIQVGNFLVLRGETGDVTGETEAYCSPCRAAARELARNAVDEDGNNAPVKLTFYTWAGAQRVVSAAKRNAEISAAAMLQIRSAGARTFGNRGQGKTWKTERAWRPRVGARK